MRKPFWEDTYSDLNASTFGGPSQEIRDIASQLPTSSRVLDLGSGEGRNALFLAERGFAVTAVDISEAGIRKLQVSAQERNLDIHTEVADMRHFIADVGLCDLYIKDFARLSLTTRICYDCERVP